MPKTLSTGTLRCISSRSSPTNACTLCTHLLTACRLFFLRSLAPAEQPENVLLSNTDVTSATLKIADFGQSKVLSKDGSAVTDAGVTGGVGTVCYMAPELVHRAGVITIMSDVKLELDAYKIDVYAPPLPPCLTIVSRLYPPPCSDTYLASPFLPYCHLPLSLSTYHIDTAHRSFLPKFCNLVKPSTMVCRQ